jgi:hypothetical protein
MTIEKLTDDERDALGCGMCRGGHRALRIIDALTAENERLCDTAVSNQRDNVQLVTQLATLKSEALMAKGLIQGLVTERDAAEARLAELTAENERLRNACLSYEIERATTEARLATAEGLLTRVRAWAVDNSAWELRDVVAAFLASAQPAQPKKDGESWPQRI